MTRSSPTARATLPCPLQNVAHHRAFEILVRLGGRRLLLGGDSLPEGGRQGASADRAVAGSGDGEVGRTFGSSITLPGHGYAASAATVSRASVARLPAASATPLQQRLASRATSGPGSLSGGAVSPTTLRRWRTLAEAALGRLGVERPVRGGDPEVQPLGAVLAEPADLAVPC